MFVRDILGHLGGQRNDLAVELLRSSSEVEDRGSDVGVASDNVDLLVSRNAGAADGERDVDVGV